MAARFQVIVACADPDAQTRFWAAALDYIEQPPLEGFPDWQAFLAQHGLADRIGTAGAIVDPDGAGPRLFFPKVPEPKTAGNRVQLDPNRSDIRRVGPEEGRKRIDAEVDRLLRLGARKVPTYHEAHETWTVMAHPEGNVFCVQ